jgi:acetyltransferase-like isoleucine patch superfamily enzyme
MTMRTRFGRWCRELLRRWLFAPSSDSARISPMSQIDDADKLVLGDDVSIGPFSYLDASGGITIGEGVQIASHSAIVTHSPHRSQRLLGPAFHTWPMPSGSQRPGWIAGPVSIGAYSFVGPHSLIEANTRLGRGTLVCAGSFVRGEYPDFVILEGRPARIVGDSRRADEPWLVRFPELKVLHDAWVLSPPRVVIEGEVRP